MKGGAPGGELLEHELEPGRFLCINCGAPLSFAADGAPGDDTLLDRAKCEYCDVVNERALAELRKERARERHLERERAARRRKTITVAGAASGVLALILVLAAVNTSSDLSEAQAEVERRRAQVTNVVERQHVVTQQWGDAPASPDRDAELSGAENRVRIERARYDEAAADYNAKVAAGWPRFVARVFRFPLRARLSDEPDW